MMLSRALMMEIGRPPAEHDLVIVGGRVMDPESGTTPCARPPSPAAAGRHAEAEALFRQALAAEVYAGSVAEVPDAGGVEAERRLLDAGIQLELARLYLDQGLLEDARAAVGLRRGSRGGEGSGRRRQGARGREAAMRASRLRRLRLPGNDVSRVRGEARLPGIELSRVCEGAGLPGNHVSRVCESTGMPGNEASRVCESGDCPALRLLAFARARECPAMSLLAFARAPNARQ